MPTPPPLPPPGPHAGPQPAPERGPGLAGGIRLFRLFGIDVFLHWTWIIFAAYEINSRAGQYSSPGWNVLEYLTLFGIVLMHEFGHSLACLSVGGRADRIMLWPLGGVAYVQPPQRPGALLWSIAAGPLVNVLLIPVTIALPLLLGEVPPEYFRQFLSGELLLSDLGSYLRALLLINVVLLVFNLLPIYPLDGGQMLRAVLWFILGRSRSLTVAAGIGLAGALVVLGLAVWSTQVMLIVIALFGAWVSWNGLRQAKALGQLAAAPRRPAPGPRCPKCAAAPPVGELWRCPCGQPLDPFESPACPRCGREIPVGICPDCGTASPLAAWYADPSTMPRPSLVPLLRMPPPPGGALLERGESG